MSFFPFEFSLHFTHSILTKYNVSEKKINIFKINDLLKNKNKKYVCLFKDYLIYDDISEFLLSYFNLKTSKSYINQNIPINNSTILSKNFIDFEITKIMQKNKIRQKLFKNIKHRKTSPHPSINIANSIPDELSSIELSFNEEYSKEIVGVPCQLENGSFYSFSSEKSTNTKKTNSNTDITSNNSKENEEDLLKKSKAKVLSIFTIADLIQPTSIFSYNKNKNNLITQTKSNGGNNNNVKCSLISKNASKSKPKKISNISIITTNTELNSKSKSKPKTVVSKPSNNLSNSYASQTISTTISNKFYSKTKRALLLSPNATDVSVNNTGKHYIHRVFTTVNNKSTSSNKLNRELNFSTNKSSEKITNIKKKNNKVTTCLSMRTNNYARTLSLRNKDSKYNNYNSNCTHSKIKTINNKNQSNKVKKSIIPEYCFIHTSKTNRNPYSKKLL